MENQNSVAYITKIISISPIEGADKIVQVKAGGWNAIVQKGIHKENDLVLCLTTDAVIPIDLAEKWGVSSYLRKNNRVRTIKLKGVISECILIPIKDLPSKFDKMDCDLVEGECLQDTLKIFKYEPPEITTTLPGGKQIKQKDNPNFNKYYKFPNIKNVPNIFTEEDKVVVSRKIHGTSARFGIVKKTKLSFMDQIKIILGFKYAGYQFIIGSHNCIKSIENL